ACLVSLGQCLGVKIGLLLGRHRLPAFGNSPLKLGLAVLLGFLLTGLVLLGSLGLFSLLTVGLGLISLGGRIVLANRISEVTARVLLDLLRVLLREPIEMLDLGGNPFLGVGGHKLSGRGRGHTATDQRLVKRRCLGRSWYREGRGSLLDFE